MASRIPQWEAIDASTQTSSEDWLNTIIGGDKPDTDFETADTTVLTATSSSNPAKPRTLKAGYSYKSQTLTVVFRDGTWWEYRGVPEEMWIEFKAAESKGRYLRSSGLDTWEDMGPAEVSKMPRHRRAQMNDIKAFADYMYKQ